MENTWTPSFAFASNRESIREDAFAQVWKGRRRYNSGHSHQSVMNIWINDLFQNCVNQQSKEYQSLAEISLKQTKRWTSDFAPSMEEAIALKAACPSINHWTWLPSSVNPLGGAKEPKRWGEHQPSGGRRPASFIAATQSLTLALLFALSFIFRLPHDTFEMNVD